ncbi:MAG: energy transducer TonB [Candidatus Sulfotelmatobacter sp.]
MFAESMLETSWGQRTRLSWTTLTSFGLQALVIGLLLLFPLWKTVGLPSGRVLPTPVSWGSPPPAAPPLHHQNTTTIVQSNLADNVLIAPREVPRQVAMIEETSAPPQMSFNTAGVQGGTGSGSGDGVWKSLGDSLNHPASLPVSAAAPTVRPFRSSSLLAGSLVRRVQPVYPSLARSARVQGTVVLSAIISKAGTIENLRVLSGHPMLVAAAIEAVSQWRYRPYILNSEPIEVETQITVSFSLSGN